MFYLILSTQTISFKYAPCIEVCRVLKQVINDIECGNLDGIVRDKRGNTIGEYTLTEDVKA